MKKIAQILSLILILSAGFEAMAQDPRNQRNREKRENKEEFRQTKQQPCMLYDSKEEYAASGFMTIKFQGVGEKDFTPTINKLLNNCRQQIKQKVGGKYQAAIHDYFDQMDIDDRSSVASHIESAGEQIIDTFLDDTLEDCREIAEDEETGYITIYIGILVNKTELANAIVSGVKEDKSIPNNIRKQVVDNEKAFRESINNRIVQ